MENNSFRALAPATRPRSPPPQEPEPVPKRKRTSVACDLCRERRTGCDGVRPVCAACRKRNTSCTYVNEQSLEMRPTVLKRENIVLREKIAAFQDIIARLGSVPPDAAQDILQRLRTGSDPITLLKSIQGQQLESVPSAQGAARAILPVYPPIQSNCEFELLIRHPNAFPTLDLSKRAQRIGNTFTSPSVASWTLDSSSSSDSSRAVSADPNQFMTPHVEEGFSFASIGDIQQLEGAADSAAPQYFDPRLAHLQIAFWTTVPITNEQAARAISCYFEVQHPIWGVFDAGLFVRDLVEFRFEFCSPLMVSALLATSCLLYAPLDEEIAAQSHAFEKEAEKLYLSETGIDSLPTIAGLMLLYMAVSTHGEGVRGLKYLTTASQAAERMKLYGVPEAPEDLGSISHETLVARSACAWGMFNMVIFLARLYLMPPVSYPPRLPFPGKVSTILNPLDNPDAMPGAPTARLAVMDRVLECVSKTWIILNEVYLVYRDQENNVGSLAFALSKYSKLLQLADDLPDMLLRRRRSTNHALMFHMTLHLGILDILRPFLAPEEQQTIRAFLPVGASPKTIFAASVRQVKGLIFEYTYQYTPATFNLFFPGAIIYAVNAILNDKLDPDQRAYLFYYIHTGKRLRSLGSARTVNGTFMALLALAYDKGVISYAEAVWFREQFNDNELLKSNEARPPRSGWAVDMDIAAGDVAAGSTDALADRFAEITLFNEFTDGVI